MTAVRESLPPESPGRILLAESPDGQFESYIRSGKVAAPEGEVSGRTRTDHAFIECRDAAVAALLARLSGVRAQGLASGDRGVRISRPKGYAPLPGGDPFPVAVPVELLDALGVDPDNNPRNADGTTLTAAQMSAVTGQKRGGIPPGDYVCRRCGIPGHYVQDCPTIGLGIAGLGHPPPGYVCKKCGVGGHFIQDCPTKQLEAAAQYLATQGQGADAETLQAIVEAQAKAKLDAARKAAEDMLEAQRAKQQARSRRPVVLWCLQLVSISR